MVHGNEQAKMASTPAASPPAATTSLYQSQVLVMNQVAPISVSCLVAEADKAKVEGLSKLGMSKGFVVVVKVLVIAGFVPGFDA